MSDVIIGNIVSVIFISIFSVLFLYILFLIFGFIIAAFCDSIRKKKVVNQNITRNKIASTKKRIIKYIIKEFDKSNCYKNVAKIVESIINKKLYDTKKECINKYINEEELSEAEKKLLLSEVDNNDSNDDFNRDYIRGIIVELSACDCCEYDEDDEEPDDYDESIEYYKKRMPFNICLGNNSNSNKKTVKNRSIADSKISMYKEICKIISDYVYKNYNIDEWNCHFDNESFDNFMKESFSPKDKKELEEKISKCASKWAKNVVWKVFPDDIDGSDLYEDFSAECDDKLYCRKKQHGLI